MKRLTLLALLGISLPASAFAIDPDIYVSGAAGISTLSHNKVDGNDSNNHINFENGFSGFVAVGKPYYNGFRSELELSFRDNSADHNGRISNTALMANGLYDFKINEPITPYIGVGVGASRFALRGMQAPANEVINGTDLEPAVQAIAGISYRITGNLSMFADYHYLTVFNTEFRDSAGYETSNHTSCQNFLIGMRYNIGAPKPVQLHIDN